MDMETAIFLMGVACEVVVEWIWVEGIIVADNVVGAVDLFFLGALALEAEPAFGLGAEEGAGRERFRLKYSKLSINVIKTVGHLHKKFGKGVHGPRRGRHFEDKAGLGRWNTE